MLNHPSNNEPKDNRTNQQDNQKTNSHYHIM